MFDIEKIVLYIGGNGVSLIELVSVITGLTCVFLAGRNIKYNFWIGYVYNILLFILFWQRQLYSVMLLQPIAFGINTFGHWRWTHPKKGEESVSGNNELKVSVLNWKQRGFFAVMVLVFSIVWGFILSLLGSKWFIGTFRPDPIPYLDAFALMMTLTAQYLSAQKKWDCWIVWLFVNTINITLYIKAGLVFMPIVSSLYLLNGIWSLWTWYRLYKKENNQIR